MKLKCLGCGYEFEAESIKLCPKKVGCNLTECACLTEVIEQDKKKQRKIADQAEGDYHGSN